MSVFKRFSKKSRFSGILTVVGAIAGLSACSGQHHGSATNSARQGIDPQPAVSAAPNVKDSLGSAKAASAFPAGLSPGNQDQVIIQKSALEKEFLFSGSAIPQIGAATSHGLASRVVMFRREGGRVFMLEATQGQVVSPTLPATIILAVFPILSETSSALVMDFNKGMHQVFTDGDMYASDEQGLDFQTTTDAEGLRASYLESVRVVGNILEIRQAALVPEAAAVPPGSPPGTQPGLSYNSYEFRYFLQPYHPNPNYTPLEIKKNDFYRVGFFEVNPVVESMSGRSVTRAAMRDLSKPVVYAISSNTPPQLHDAVRDGILYWNKVFGREVVQVIDAPQGVTAPDPQYNIIQWVENDSAGSAYADVLMDPRSGEILHSQVYLTSVFSTGTLHKLPQVVRQYQPAAPKSFEKGLFASSRVCDRGVDPDADLAMLAVKSQGPVDENAYKKVVKDYVQFVVTHEVGHTLGLRHNFAGSLASTATPDQTDQMFGDYLLKGTIPAKGQMFSSSVMDYNVLSEDVLHVAMFNSQNLVLPYDQMAIDWAYNGKQIDYSSKTLPPYCSDVDNGKLADCLTFDRGAKPIIANEQAINKSLRLAGLSLAETYINAKAPADSRDALPMIEVPLDPDATVKALMTTLKSQITWFKSEGNLAVSVTNLFPFLTDFYKSDVYSTIDDSVAEQVKDAGGVAKILLPLVLDKLDSKQDMVTIADNELSSYLAREDVKNGMGANGKPYSLSDADISVIKANGQKFFTEVRDRAFEQSLAALAAGQYTNKKLAPQVEGDLGAIAEGIILAHSEDAGSIVAPGIAPPAPPAQSSASSGTPQAASPSGSPSSTPSGAPSSTPSGAPSSTPSGAPSGTPAQAKTQAPKPAYGFTFTLAQRIAATKLLSLSLGGKDTDWSMEAREETFKKLDNYLTSVMGQSPGKVDASTLGEPLREWFTDQFTVLSELAASAAH